MKVLIFGANGLVGHHLSRFLGDKGIAVVEVERRSRHADYHCDAGMLARVLEVLRYETPSVVVNAVKSAVSTDDSDLKKDEVWKANVTVAENIARACARSGTALVHLSTAWVYEGKAGEVYTEESIPYPLNFYAFSKAVGEERVLHYLPDALILRPDTVFGPDARGLNIFSRVRTAAANGVPLAAADDQNTQPIAAGELARVTYELIAARKTGVWNVVGPDYVSRYDLAVFLCECFGYDKALIRRSSCADRKIRVPQHLRLDTSKLLTVTSVPPLALQVQALRRLARAAQG
jgi:dTDP-4-dehydrorhamnose reductase